MGLLILVIIVVAIFMMSNSGGSSSNSKSTYANRMIGNMPTRNAYGPKEIMYVAGCISYYALLYGQGILTMAGMPSKDAERGTFVSIRVDNLSSISRFFPQDLKRAVDSIAWSTKTNEKLKIEFSMNKADYMNIRDDCLQAYRNGLSAAKFVERESGLSTHGSLYVYIRHPHFWSIDNAGHSSEYADDYQRIF